MTPPPDSRNLEARSPGTASQPGPSAASPGEPEPDPEEPNAGAESLGSDLFREEAVQEHRRAHGQGRLLRISPRWTRWAYWMLFGAFLAVLLFVVFGQIHEYASGPAIVRMADPTELTALASGTVDRVPAHPGERVEPDQVLVTFNADAERSFLERIQGEFELQLVRLLRDPNDEDARELLAGLRAERRLAEKRLEDRTVRAPHAGTVSDIRIRAGQFLAAGEPVLTLVAEDRPHTLLAMLPGRYRPLLEPGMILRFEVSGYSHAYQSLTVRGVSDEVVGPAAVRKFLGAAIADAVPLTGPVTLVYADLDGRTFRSGGEEHSYYPGMQGVAEVSVRRESILVTLIPGLRALAERLHG